MLKQSSSHLKKNNSRPQKHDVKHVPYWGPANIRYLSKKKKKNLVYVPCIKFETKFKEDRQWSYKRNNEALSHNHCCRAKIISITYSGCVFGALGIQHAKRMRRNILASMACPTVHFFPHYFINGTTLRGRGEGGREVMEHKICTLISLQL